MSRYTGPVCRLCRRQSMKLFLKGERCFTPKCAIERRRGATSAGPRGRRRRTSEWGLQLLEKQKARQIYGVIERQFRAHFQEALRRPGVTGEVFLQILEGRLDNVVFRLGWAESRNMARQLVSHGHIAVDGRRVSASSHVLQPEQVVSWTPQGRKGTPFEIAQQEARRRNIPSWLQMDPIKMEGKTLRLPERAEIDTQVNDRQIVEFYSR